MFLVLRTFILYFPPSSSFRRKFSEGNSVGLFDISLIAVQRGTRAFSTSQWSCKNEHSYLVVLEHFFKSRRFWGSCPLAPWTPVEVHQQVQADWQEGIDLRGVIIPQASGGSQGGGERVLISVSTRKNNCGTDLCHFRHQGVHIGEKHYNALMAKDRSSSAVLLNISKSNHKTQLIVK